MSKKYVQINSFTNAKLLNRYLALLSVKVYSPILKFKKGKPYQDIISTSRRYQVQWKNIWNDLKGLINNPLQTTPRVAYSLMAFLFIVLGKHEQAFNVAFVIGAIALDGTVVTGNNNSSISVTVASNSDRMMVLSYATYQGGGPTSATYGSNALTKTVEQVGSYNEKASIWSFVAPTVGTANMVLVGAGDWHGVGIYSLYNVDQNLPTNFSTTGGDSSGTSLALTTGSNNSWVIACIEAEPAITMTTSGATEDWNLTGQSYQHGEGQHILKATAGSQTMTSSLGYGARWNTCNIEIKVVAEAPAASTPLRMMLGMGI